MRRNIIHVILLQEDEHWCLKKFAFALEMTNTVKKYSNLKKLLFIIFMHFPKCFFATLPGKVSLLVSTILVVFINYYIKITNNIHFFWADVVEMCFSSIFIFVRQKSVRRFRHINSFFKGYLWQYFFRDLFIEIGFRSFNDFLEC